MHEWCFSDDAHHSDDPLVSLLPVALKLSSGGVLRAGRMIAFRLHRWAIASAFARICDLEELY
jgi:hypothetical protein